jgi:hypothetical protein
VVTATFSAIEYTLTTATVGNGSIVVTPPGPYSYGDVVTLTATADTGWDFTAWSGDLTGSTTPDTVTISADTVVTATFSAIEYTLTTATVGNGSVDKDPNQGTYTYGDVVTLTATADTGWDFTAWSGDLSGSLTTRTLTIDEDKTVTATFTIQSGFNVLTNTVGSGSIVVTPPGPYSYGDVVTLTATADTGWDFTAWSGDLSGSTTPDTVTISADTVVTATFSAIEYTLTTATVGNGSIVVTPPGPYSYGDVVTLTATADTGWDFTAWSGDLSGSLTTRTLTIDEDKTVTATFTIQSGFNVLTNTVGSGTVSVTPPGPYSYGDVVTLTATADTGWDFTAWSGDLSGSLTTRTLTIDEDKTVTATFTIQSGFNVLTNTVGNGSIVVTPPGPYSYGDVVTLTATADTGWDFTAWSGDLSGSLTTRTLTIDEDKTVTATFTIQSGFNVLTNTVGNGSIVVTPPGPYSYGDVVTLTATADTGWDFTAWSGDLSGSLTTRTLTIDEDKTVTATFTIQSGFNVLTNTVGNGSIVVTPPGPYSYGDVVTLTATADTGWDFTAWSGDLSGSLTTRTLTIDEDKTVTATFTIQSGFNVLTNTVGNGSIVVTPPGPYSYGDVVTLTATADTGWDFDSWSGDLSGSLTTRTLTIDEDKTVTATFTIQSGFNVLTNTVGSGTVSVTPPGPYSYGDVVTLTATADTGWDFTAWSGDLSGSLTTRTLTIDEDKTVTATFTIQSGFNVLTNTVGSGTVSVTPPGPYSYGDVVTLTATADTGWDFDSWSGDLSGSLTTRTLTIDEDKTVTATFTIQSGFNVLTNTVGSGTVSVTPPGPYSYGDVVTLTATADTGWDFTAWSGDLSGSLTTRTLTIDEDKTVTATFTIQSGFNVLTNTVGNGSIVVTPPGPYSYGDVVTLTATADTGWDFTAWSGDLSGSLTTRTLTIDEDKTVTATFTIQSGFNVLTNTVGNGSIVVTPPGPYSYGDVVTLTATADTGWDFDSWSGDLSGSLTTRTLTIDEDKTVTATFTIQSGFNVLTNTVGSGTIVVTPPGPYSYGDVVTLTATADTGWDFTAWSGDLSGSLTTRTLTIDDDKTVTATFTIQSGFNVLTNTVGNGSIVVTPPGPYSYGDVVTLTATADTGWDFTAWSGDLSGSLTTRTLTIDEDKTVTATFTIQSGFNVLTNTVGSGSIVVTPPGPYSYGDVVTLTATADTGWDFTAWSGDLSGSLTTRTLTIDEDKTVTATFTIQSGFNVLTNTVGNGSIVVTPPRAIQLR